MRGGGAAHAILTWFNTLVLTYIAHAANFIYTCIIVLYILCIIFGFYVYTVGKCHQCVQPGHVHSTPFLNANGGMLQHLW
jgi:hypothetical protein